MIHYLLNNKNLIYFITFWSGIMLYFLILSLFNTNILGGSKNGILLYSTIVQLIITGFSYMRKVKSFNVENFSVNRIQWTLVIMVSLTGLALLRYLSM